MGDQSHGPKLSLGALLITLGIIFGDIGTSPLDVYKRQQFNRLLEIAKI